MIHLCVYTAGSPIIEDRIWHTRYVEQLSVCSMTKTSYLVQLRRVFYLGDTKAALNPAPNPYPFAVVLSLMNK